MATLTQGMQGNIKEYANIVEQQQVLLKLQNIAKTLKHIGKQMVIIFLMALFEYRNILQQNIRTNSVIYATYIG